MLAKLREQCLSLVVINTGVDDHIFAFLPVNGRGNAVFIADLKGCGRGQSSYRRPITQILTVDNAK